MALTLGYAPGREWGTWHLQQVGKRVPTLDLQAGLPLPAALTALRIHIVQVSDGSPPRLFGLPPSIGTISLPH